MAGEPLILRVHRASPLEASLGAFQLDREAPRSTPKTVEQHTPTCRSFAKWLKAQGVINVPRITPYHIRAYLVSLQPRRC